MRASRQPSCTPVSTSGANGDGDGNRVKSTINGVTTVYIGDHYELRTDGAGQTTRLYYYAGSQRIAVRENGTLSWLLSDHLGSTSLVTTSDAALSAEFRYKAFGETRYEAGTAPTDYQYTGQRAEDLLGLYFYRARWYDPHLGRWTQADTMIPRAGSPQVLDRYAYGLDNPVKYRDSTGHDADCGIGDRYCDDLRREYFYSDWQKAVPFREFMRGKEAHEFYESHPVAAFEDRFGLCSGCIPGQETDTSMWARIYSEDVLHEWFNPFNDLLLMERVEEAYQVNDAQLWWILAGALMVTDIGVGQFGANPGNIGGMMDDVVSGGGDWRVLSAHTEPATRRGARQGGVSIQLIYQNQYTGQRIVRHTVLDSAGRVVHEDFRLFIRPRFDELFEGK